MNLSLEDYTPVFLHNRNPLTFAFILLCERVLGAVMVKIYGYKYALIDYSLYIQNVYCVLIKAF